MKNAKPTRPMPRAGKVKPTFKQSNEGAKRPKQPRPKVKNAKSSYAKLLVNKNNSMWAQSKMGTWNPSLTI